MGEVLNRGKPFRSPSRKVSREVDHQGERYRGRSVKAAGSAKRVPAPRVSEVALTDRVIVSIGQ